ncbi:hypothetical protein TrLO_g9721 [Triparma laevis f. longispina]|uniref:Uncharacterized protein n=1 Tax=Triparma laevis f. longispina TaxID=1714387 RepID=A0A9W7F2I0_9STRA|nr:hypothetical protein TrLO_g9721 [Triparma laevis f. longispina]
MRVYLLTLTLLLTLKSTSGLEAKWTSAQDSDDPGVPLSSTYRSQITKLSTAIDSSSNPDETLKIIAEGQGMKPDELKKVIDKVKRDSVGGVSGGSSGFKIVSVAVKLILSVVAKLLSLVLSPILVVFRGLAKPGSSTGSSTGSIRSILLILALGLLTSGGIWWDVRKGNPLAVKGRYGFKSFIKPSDKYLGEYVSGLSDFNNNYNDVSDVGVFDNSVVERSSFNAEEYSFEEVENVVEGVFGRRKFTEFNEFGRGRFYGMKERELNRCSGLRIKGRSKSGGEVGCILSRGLGWNCVGVRVVEVEESEESGEKRIKFKRIYGGGEITIGVRIEGGVVECEVEGTGCFGEGEFIDSTCSSIVKSIKLGLSRKRSLQSQTSEFKSGVKIANDKRKEILAKRNEEIETMDGDRKRRWKRNWDKRGNSNWRPSGRRQQSPNNC